MCESSIFDVVTNLQPRDKLVHSLEALLEVVMNKKGMAMIRHQCP
jgi:hypothetical protein